MVWLVDDVAEAALGPWGLLVGVGVGVGVLARKRLAPAASTALAGGVEAGERARERVSRWEGGRRARSWASGVASSAGSLAVVERGKTTLAEVGDWWNDLYAEARSEWEADRGSRKVGVTEATERLEEASRQRQSDDGPKRDASGRFVKQPSE